MLIESVAKFPIESIKLYDNNDDRQRKVAEACAIIVREKNPEIKFSYTTNPAISILCLFLSIFPSPL